MFCIGETYYNRYKAYLTANFPGEFTNFADGVKKKFADRLNKAFSCDAFNNLVPKNQNQPCTAQQACSVVNDEPVCLNKINCNGISTNPFGMFFTRTSCELDRAYCFYDRSHTTVNSCFNCDTSMSCYDYKTEDACNSDHCKLSDCKWKPLEPQFGTGVCIRENDYNCQWCKKPETSTIGNADSFNDVFDLCTQEKSDILSEGDFKCYYRSGTSKNCNEVTCLDYGTEQCTVQIAHDENNLLTRTSNDRCGIKACQNIGNKCVKNYDGDSQPDCTTTECEFDYFAPETTLLQAFNNKGIVKSILVQIYDKTNADSQSFLRITPDYTTFICLEPCGANGHPYELSTKSGVFRISGLSVFDGIDGRKLLSLNEGLNTIRYYSQDPAKNIGEVKKLRIEAYASSNGPEVLAVKIENSFKVGDRIFTNNQKPTIEVEFLEPAILTSAALVTKDKTKRTNLQFDTQLSKKVNVIVPAAMQNGEYLLELNAKNEKGILMDKAYTDTIVIDNQKPSLEILPKDQSVISTNSKVTVKLTFDEEVVLDSVSLNQEDIKKSFSPADNRVFTATIDIPDGNKKLDAAARDYAGNTVSGSSNFIVDVKPLSISLAKPKFGVAPSYDFEIVVNTDNDANCKYSFENEFLFESMLPFTTSGGTSHTISHFNQIPEGDTGMHKLYVKCRDSKTTASQSFDLSVDTTKPDIESAMAFPNPVAEEPSITTLTVKADDTVICKYSASSRDLDFAAMEGKFEGYDKNEFNLINRQKITVNGQGDYKYYVACKNRAELVSDTEEINFKVDFSGALTIISHTQPLFSSTKVTLSIETNKRAICTYSTSQNMQNPSAFGPEDYVHKKDITLQSGKYTYYAECRDPAAKSANAKIDFVVDTIHPVMLSVNDVSTLDNFPEKTCNSDMLRVKFLGEDKESGISNYFYSLLKGNQPILSLVEVLGSQGDQWMWVKNLELEDNTKYTFSVKARDYAGLESPFKGSDGITVDTSICKEGPNCGDSSIDSGELCDPDAGVPIFGAFPRKCTDFNNFISGTLKCTYSTSSTPCVYDTSDCVAQQYCGDGIIQPGEHCETKGNVLGAAKTCADLGFKSGTLGCAANCFIDTSGCIPKNACGNGLVDPGEQCDGTNLGPIPESKLCSQYSSFFTGGTLSCGTNCKIDTSKCSGLSGTCGNGVINIGEKCDGNRFGIVSSCTGYSDFVSGDIQCKNCELDTSQCIPKNKCGNGLIDQGESCDGTNLGILTTSCSAYTPYFKSGTLSCDSDCKLNTLSCTSAELCNNGILDANEECDTTKFKELDGTCKGYSPAFASGSLECNSQCKISTSKCVKKGCGDGVIDADLEEQCDIDPTTKVATFGKFNGDCTNYDSKAFKAGKLECAECKIGTSKCTPVGDACGDGVAQASEECDKKDSKLDLKGATCKALGYDGGNLDCTDKCKLDKTKCTTISDKKVCGDSIVQKPNDGNVNEQCDGTNLDGKKCDSFPAYTGGQLLCNNAYCSFDYSQCTPKDQPKCQDGSRNQLSEECDKEDFAGKTCKSLGYSSGALKCTSGCKLDTSPCVPETGKTYCGDNTLQKPNSAGFDEQCEGTNVNSKKCTDFDSYTAGTLECRKTCEYSYDECTGGPGPSCQDGVANQLSEECDKDDLKGQTCKSLGYDSGTPKCTSGCKLDKSGCGNEKKVCGDSIVQKPNDGNVNEQCDGTNLDGKKCSTVGGYTSGTLNCKSDCSFDYSACVDGEPICGDSAVNRPQEECNKTDLRGRTCQTFGYKTGNLKCTDSCLFDLTSCANPETLFCGDAKVSKPNSVGFNEDCDTINLDGKTCNSFESYISGNLACYRDCVFNYANCVESPPKCGDDIVDVGEQCDSSNLGDKTCTSFTGFTGGNLSCDGECEFNMSKCTSPPPCGDGDLDAGELCDDKVPVFGTINSCKWYSEFISGTLGCSNCQIDKTNCVRQPYCGDGIINSGEECDKLGKVFGSAKTCADLGFKSGTLDCAANCFIDTLGCTPKNKCGNGLIDQGESCDGTNFGPIPSGRQCQLYSTFFTGGILSCDSSCKIDTSKCSGGSGTCGDNIINIGETCEGQNFGSLVTLCTSYDNFRSGTLKCTSCRIDTSQCIPKDTCGNGLIDQGESCDGTNLGILTTSCSAYTPYFKSGTLSCGSNCRLDTSGCGEAEKCGNGVIDSSELCDDKGPIFANLTDTSCKSWSSSFVDGNLTCRSCRVRTTACKTSTPGLTCRDRGDCEVGVACTDNSDCKSSFCNKNKCTLPSCSDLIKNQAETDVDCGGPCTKCDNDKRCDSGSDCRSNFCTLGYCKTIEACSDKKLSSSESDVDCGGPCTRCLEGKSCKSKTDCQESLDCVEFLCKKTQVIRSEDSDGDGLPDDWELENGLDPNDPNDAGYDPDEDGLTNREEYGTISTYGRSTDPNLADTDGDGFSDMEELDAGTNPIDPESFPKSNFTKVLLFVFGILILAAGFGFLAYKVIERRREERMGTGGGMTTVLDKSPQESRRSPFVLSKRRPLKEILKKKAESREKLRKSIFTQFEAGEHKARQKEEYKPESKPPVSEVAKSPGTKPEMKKPAGEKGKLIELKLPKQPKARRKPSGKKTTEDIFSKLKDISRSGKKLKHKPKNAAK